jgi:hypothetical protein
MKSRESKPNGKTAQQLGEHGLERNMRQPERSKQSQFAADMPAGVRIFGPGAAW